MTLLLALALLAASLPGISFPMPPSGAVAPGLPAPAIVTTNSGGHAYVYSTWRLLLTKVAADVYKDNMSGWYMVTWPGCQALADWTEVDVDQVHGWAYFPGSVDCAVAALSAP